MTSAALPGRSLAARSSSSSSLQPGVPAMRVPRGEHDFLLLCSVSGALVLAASRDLVGFIVALEVVTLPTFALVHGASA